MAMRTRHPRGIPYIRLIWRSTLLIAALLLPVRAARGASAPHLTLTTIHFVSGTTGWGTSDTALLRTDDGGRTWRPVTPPGATIGPLFPPAAAFEGATDVRIATAFPNANPRIFRTADGGRTWAQFVLPVPSLSGRPLGISELDFINRRQGWAVESLGGGVGSFSFALFRTADGGAHWSSVAQTPRDARTTPGAYPRNVQGIHFDSATSGWTTTVIFANPQLSGLFHSTDGGHTWRKVPLPTVGAFSGGFVAVEPPIFFDARDGALIVATSTALGIYSTHDGGKAWAPTIPSQAALPLIATQPFSNDFVDARHVWIVAGSRLYFTGDLGRHWSLVRQSLGFGSIAALDFIDAQTGSALGGLEGDARGTHSVLHTTADGGHTLTVLQPAAA